MAKEKENKKSEEKNVWEQILDSVTDDNKDAIKKELSNAIEFLEKSGGDKELIAGFKATLKKVK